MGVVNVAWRYASKNGPFSQRIKNSGWQAMFDVDQIAFLQCGLDEKKRESIRDQLIADCSSGLIECLVSECHPEYVQCSGGWTFREDDDSIGADIGGPGDLVFSVLRNKPDPDGWIKRYSLTAPQAVKWIKEQGCPPSEHIHAWVRATAPDALETPAAAPVTPTPEKAEAPAPPAPGTPTTVPDAPATPASKASPDPDMLATPDELIAAFGAFTGMNKAWFDNVKDTPGLKAARRYAGAGGNNSAAPLFDPYEVMLWLVDPKRKKGSKISEKTAWRMLKKHFPKSHEAHAIGDPNEGSPG